MLGAVEVAVSPLVAAAFEFLWKETENMVMQIAQSRGLRDWEDTCQTVALNLLSVFPRMFAEDRAALAAGQPSPHRWRGYTATVAANAANRSYRRQRRVARNEVSLSLTTARAARTVRVARALPGDAFDNAASHSPPDAFFLVDRLADCLADPL